jgi:hypothetical protein
MTTSGKLSPSNIDMWTYAHKANEVQFPYRLNRNRSFLHYQTTKNIFGYDFRSKFQKTEYLNHLKLDELFLQKLGIDFLDKPRIYAGLLPFDIYLHEFFLACLEGLMIQNPEIRQFLDERLRSEKSEYPAGWVKIAKMIMRNEETLRAATDPEYLKGLSSNVLYDIVNNIEENRDAKKPVK